MKDGATLLPQFAKWIKLDYLEGVIDGIRLAANVPEVVQWFQRLHDARRPLDTLGDFPTFEQQK